jgi:hypothetical protein
MIAMVSPTHSDVKNTRNTLRYADRVKKLRVREHGKMISNEDGEISKGLMQYILMDKVYFFLFLALSTNDDKKKISVDMIIILVLHHPMMTAILHQVIFVMMMKNKVEYQLHMPHRQNTYKNMKRFCRILVKRF